MILDVVVLESAGVPGDKTTFELLDNRKSSRDGGGDDGSGESATDVDECDHCDARDRSNRNR